MMSRFFKLIPPLVALLVLAILGASLWYWYGDLRALTRTAPQPVLAAAAPVSVDDAAHLFGGPPDNQVVDIHLLGVLNLDQRVAAIVSVGSDAPQAVALDQPIGADAKLVEVRSRSIVVDQHGLRSEIFIPASGSDISIFMR